MSPRITGATSYCAPASRPPEPYTFVFSNWKAPTRGGRITPEETCRIPPLILLKGDAAEPAGATAKLDSVTATMRRGVFKVFMSGVIIVCARRGRPGREVRRLLPDPTNRRDTGTGPADFPSPAMLLRSDR